MSRRVVFAGGIQVKALARAYRLNFAADRDEDVFFIGADTVGRDAAQRVIAAADIVVTDVSEAGETVPERLVSANTERIAVPAVSGAFLWPYAGRPHPRNRATDSMPGGPYPDDFGDAFLDSMLETGVAHDVAIDRYLAFDVAGAVDLDALLQDTLSRQAQLDARTGFDLATFVSEGFRAGNLLATLDRMHLALFQRVAATLLDRMSIGGERADSLTEAPFTPGAMPIHPAVLRHFGMQGPPDGRYPVLDEGRFTFEQYCRRYLRFEWNEALHAAMALAENDPKAALPGLRLALRASPESAAGLAALAAAERATGHVAAAETVASADKPGAADATLPHTAASATLPQAAVDASPWPELQPVPAAAPAERGDAEPGSGGWGAEPVFAETGFAGLHYSSLDEWPRAAVDEQAGLPAAEPANPFGQSYIELPRSGFYEEPAASPSPETPGRYVRLEPASELIEVLPRLLRSSHSPAGVNDRPFAAMPETMPPPPMRPVLPPELHPNHEKRGFVARLFGGRRR